jgi:hypothetical protein
MTIVNYRYRKKYAKHILVYINVKIVEISKYDLSCTYEILYSTTYVLEYNNSIGGILNGLK